MLKTHYFLCLPFLLIFTDLARSEPDYKFNLEAGGWLKLYSTAEVWQEAFLRCLSDGAVLASPLNKELANALHAKMAHFGMNGQIFLGTHDLFAKGHFTTVEGVPLSNLELHFKSPHLGNGADTGDCLTMSDDGSVTFSSCNSALPYICYRKLGNQTMNECGTFDNEYHLNQKTGSCYKIHRKRQTWSRAYSICDSEGAHLVILNDEEEVRIVKDMIPELTGVGNVYDGFHIGLVAWGPKRIWTTIHGEKLEAVFNKWGSGQPDNFQGNQNRGLCFWNGMLDDVAQDYIPLQFMFACEKSPESRFEKVVCTEQMMKLCSEPLLAHD